MAKTFQFEYLFESLSEDPTYFRKPMFGALAIYCYGKMLFLLSESPGDRTYKNKKFKFDIWDGLLICTDYSVQDKLINKFPCLIQHPVLPKWLYLTTQTEDFEYLANKLIHMAKNQNPYIGITPKHSKKKRKAKTKKTKTKSKYK